MLELLTDERALAGGSKRNRARRRHLHHLGGHVPDPLRRLVCDAMTSGGLLAAVAPERAAEIDGWVVGRLVPGPPGTHQRHLRGLATFAAPTIAGQARLKGLPLRCVDS